jgi:hypothetical protein
MPEKVKDKVKEKIQANVVFGHGKEIAMTGIIGGVVLALGLPWIVLVYGQSLGTVLMVIFVLCGLGFGGLVALVSAFFGLVMPRQVDGTSPTWWGREGWKPWCRDWDDLADEDWRDWTASDWKAWAEKKKRRH